MTPDNNIEATLEPEQLTATLTTDEFEVLFATGMAIPGPPGPQGPVGPEGPQGIQGPEGPQGPPGVGIDLQGSVPTYDDLPDGTSPTIKPGDAYITEDTGDIWIWQSTGPGAPGEWVNGGHVVGPPGPAGPQGPTGAQGPIGDTGPAGPEGDPGAEGPQGEPGPEGIPLIVNGAVIGDASSGPSAGGGVSSMTVAAFQTATSNGTVQGSLSVVRLRDGLYECVWNGTSWDYYHGSIRCERPLLSGFASDGTTPQTATVTDNLHINVTGPNSGRTSMKQSITAAPPYRIEIGFLYICGPESYAGVSVQVHSTVSNKGRAVDFQMAAEHLVLHISTNARAYAGTSDSVAARQMIASKGVIYLGIEFDGTTFTPVCSADGIDWIRTASTQALATWVVNAPDEAIFQVYSSTNYRPLCKILHWKQRQL